MNMFTTIKTRLLVLATALVFISGLSACKKDNKGGTTDEKVNGEYAVIYSVGDDSYLLNINSLTEGKVSPKGSGIDVSQIFTWGENIIQKGRYFYFLNPTGRFSKHLYQDGKLTKEGEIPFTAFPSPYVGWSLWLDNNQVMFGPRGSNLYAIINVSSMTIVKSGEFDLPSVPAGHSRRVYSAFTSGNKVMIGYGLYNEVTQLTTDESYLASMDLPSLANFKVTSKDGRSAPAGPLRNGYFGQFVDNGNDYLLTHPMPMLGGNKPNMPTGFFRIKAGTDTFDPNYFFNISALTNGDNQLGVCYVGNGKAILANAKDAKNRVKEKDDWWYADMWEYLVVDVNAQKVIKRLDFPPLLNSRSAIVLDGKAYIAVNDPKADAIYVYEYDPIADTLKKGLRIDGGSDNTPILYKLN